MKTYGLVAAALTATTVAGAILVVGRSAAQQNGRVALSGVRIEKGYTYPGGAYHSSMQFTIAVRRDGSHAEARIVTAADGTQKEVRWVVDGPGARRTAIDGVSESTTTTHYSPKAAAMFQRAPRSCGDRSAATESLLGYPVTRVTETLPAAPGALRTAELWLAPDLDCLALKEKHYLRETGKPATLINEKEIISVTIGEPDAALFAITEGYTERSPSQVMAEHARRNGRADCPGCDATGARLDKVYESQQKR